MINIIRYAAIVFLTILTIGGYWQKRKIQKKIRKLKKAKIKLEGGGNDGIKDV